jgi:hypothetical protein
VRSAEGVLGAGQVAAPKEDFAERVIGLGRRRRLERCELVGGRADLAFRLFPPTPGA